jgi:polysaccharide pyruvyl transferase CsaB
MTRVLVTGFIGSDNLGDEAIFEALVQRLEGLGDVEIVAFSSRPERHYGSGRARLLRPRSFGDVRREIGAADLVVCGGGGLIQDQTSVYNLAAHVHRLLIAHALGKPYLFYAVGVTPMINKLNRRLASFLFRRAAAITVRDRESANALVALGVPASAVRVTADPVANLQLPPRRSPDPSRAGARYVAVALRPWFEIARYLPVSAVRRLGWRPSQSRRRQAQFAETLAELLDRLIEEYDLDVRFVPFWHERDSSIHAEVCVRMWHANRCVAPDRRLDIHAASELLAGADMVIAMRLHALILAAQHARPMVGLAYTDKVANLMRRLELRRRCVGVDPLDGHRLWRISRDTYLRRDRESAHVRRMMALLQEEERFNERMLRAVLDAVAAESEAPVRRVSQHSHNHGGLSPYEAFGSSSASAPAGIVSSVWGGGRMLPASSSGLASDR